MPSRSGFVVIFLTGSCGVWQSLQVAVAWCVDLTHYRIRPA
jgi:hypothetical protein